jgi:uncharacterized membrane protein
VSGEHQGLHICVALLTVIVSWTVVNTIYPLRYADPHFGSKGEGIAFDDAVRRAWPNFRNFAYVAFTIGMTYQVSDRTVRDSRIRRAVLSHALLSYVFDVVIVSGCVSLISSLIR